MSPYLLERSSDNEITSYYTRKVSRSLKISGKLPNAVFTLCPSTIMAIIAHPCLNSPHSTAHSCLFALCAKFFLAHNEFNEYKQLHHSRSLMPARTMMMHGYRLYGLGGEAAQVNGEDVGEGSFGMIKDELSEERDQGPSDGSQPVVPAPTLIRLPPVLSIIDRMGRYMVKTTRGVYTWGGGEGVNPHRINLEGVTDITMHQGGGAFIRAPGGWYESRFTPDRRLSFIQGSERVIKWSVVPQVTFAWTDCDLLAFGGNLSGQCGVGSASHDVATLTPVTLPDDVKGRVDRVVSDGLSTFFISGSRCFACGNNRYGELGLRTDDHSVLIPTELSYPIVDIITSDHMTIALDLTGQLLCCGKNEHSQLNPSHTNDVIAMLPLAVPGPVSKVSLELNNVYILLRDGGWLARGEFEDGFFNVTGLDDGDAMSGWVGVMPGFAEELSNQTPSNYKMLV